MEGAMTHFLRRLDPSHHTGPKRGRPSAWRSRAFTTRGFLRLAGTYLIAGSGLIVVAVLVAAVRADEPLSVLFALPIAPVWLGVGLLMIASLVSDASWDGDDLHLSLAFETRVVNRREILRVRAVTVRVWPLPGGTVFMLLKYRRLVRGQAKSAWALLTLSEQLLSSWPSPHSSAPSPRRHPEQL
jgi:hypothetical protein